MRAGRLGRGLASAVKGHVPGSADGLLSEVSRWGRTVLLRRGLPQVGGLQSSGQCGNRREEARFPLDAACSRGSSAVEGRVTAVSSTKGREWRGRSVQGSGRDKEI